ncbi:MAG TPA: ATP-grasp domain-containing protein [Patescibacteria group bacterium]
MDELIKKINDSGYNLYFLVVDSNLDIDLFKTLKNFHLIYAYSNDNLAILRQEKAPYFCLEEQGVILEEKNSGRLLSHPMVIDYIKTDALLNNKKVAIIPFKPSAKIDFICNKFGWLNVSNPAPLNRQLEDKLKFVKLADDNNLPFIPSHIEKFNKKNFEKFKLILGPKLVIQTHFGWAGNSTISADYYEEAAAKVPEGVIVKYSPFLEGYSLLNNCCLTKNGVIQSPPALQYTGLKPFTENPFTTVGRQWPSLAPTEINLQVKNITNNFSEVIRKYNYRGFFGLDFLVNSNRIYLMECNPRLTASFAFYTQIEFRNNITPLFLYHLAEFLDIDNAVDIQTENQRFFNAGIVGSEITYRDNTGIIIRKYNDFDIFTPTLNPITIKEEVLKHFDFDNASQKTSG